MGNLKIINSTFENIITNGLCITINSTTPQNLGNNIIYQSYTGKRENSLNGDGIFNSNNLIIENSIFNNIKSTNTIYNSGIGNIDNTTFINITAVNVNGGSIYNKGTLNLTNILIKILLHRMVVEYII